MSEHWKSTPKYWCKHCSIYVKDTTFERKQHENTGKHQGNLKRFLNGIQKEHAKTEREKDKVKAEVERLNRIAGSSSSNTSAASPSLQPTRSRTSTNLPSSQLSAADQKRQWAQLAEMGIAIPEHARQDIAQPGDWQTLSRKIVDKSEETVDDKVNIGVRKRKFEGQEEEEEEDGDFVVRRGWGSATKSYPDSQQASNDLGTLLSAPIFKKKKSGKAPLEEDAKTDLGSLNVVGDSADQPTSKGETASAPLESAALNENGSEIDPEIKNELSQEGVKPVGSEHQQQVSAPLFKRRRPKHGHSSNIT